MSSIVSDKIVEESDSAFLASCRHQLEAREVRSDGLVWVVELVKGWTVIANQLARRVGNKGARKSGSRELGQGKLSSYCREATDQDMLEGSRSELVLTRWDLSLKLGVCVERRPENLGDSVRALLQWVLPPFISTWGRQPAELHRQPLTSHSTLFSVFDPTITVFKVAGFELRLSMIEKSQDWEERFRREHELTRS